MVILEFPPVYMTDESVKSRRLGCVSSRVRFLPVGDLLAVRVLGLLSEFEFEFASADFFE